MDVSNNSGLIEELQMLEQQLNAVLAQKQMFQVDSQEISNALKELKETKDDVYKVLSGIMIKSDKNELIKDLEERKKLSDLRINSIEKQEKALEERSTKLKEKLKGSLIKPGR